MRHLELFSGTHSFGKVSSKYNFEVYSLDRDLGPECPFKTGYKSKKHIKTDIMTWNYKEYPKYYFDLITASPVCLWWSCLRNTSLGRKLKGMKEGEVLTREHLQADIDNFGKPMVDKVFEILEYFQPTYWIIENPQTGKMKHYIEEKYSEFNTFYDVDYCMYSEWGYKKRTRFWTNINGFDAKLCDGNCGNMITIKTQDNAIHKGTKEKIKGDTRTLHKNPIGDYYKAKNRKIHKGIVGFPAGSNCKLIKKMRNDPNSEYIEINGILKKKHSISIQDLGGGKSRLERYRIPLKLIQSFLDILDYDIL